MSVMILDKDTNKQITVAAGETNNKAAPIFTGTGRYQDPLKFLEDFDKASKWNNWRTDDRKKETFLLCLSGHAERWVKNHMMANLEAFKKLEFNNETEDCLLYKFKANYITEEWYEIYTKQYEDRVQLPDETPLEYMEVKRYLLQRGGEDCIDRTEKQKVRDMMKGLLPQVRAFCEKKVKDPFNSEAKRSIETLDGFEKLMKWAESCLYEDKKVLALDGIQEPEILVAVNTVRRNNGNGQRNNYEERREPRESSANQGNRGHQQQYSDFEKQVLSHLGKLDTIENDLAVLRDRVDIMEKNNKSNTKYISATNADGGPKCFNCQRSGHFGRDCNQPCRTCENANHCGGNCPVRFGSNNRGARNGVNYIEEEGQQARQDFQKTISESREVNVIEYGVEPNNTNIAIPHLIAATGTQPKKTPEELKAVKLLNLEKARAAKAMYKKMDDEAKQRGEVPPSISRKLERDFPLMLDENKNVRSLDIKERLWETNVSIALPQLLYYAPELWYQYLHLFGGQPIAAKRKPFSNHNAMDVDTTVKVANVQNINMDTTQLSNSSKTSLQSVYAKVNDVTDLSFLIDGGAVVSVIPLHLVKQLGKENDIYPTNKTLRYGGGEIDIPVGVIKLKLQFAEDIVVHHIFCVTKNISTPVLIGMDFIEATKAIQDAHNQTLTFRTKDKDYVVSTFKSDEHIESQSQGVVDGAVLDSDAIVITPVLITKNEINPKTKDISIGYEWKFEPGEAQLLWVKMDESTATWEDDMVLQPASNLLSKLGLFLVPTVLNRNNNEEPYCMIIVNMTQKPVTLKKNTKLGQLFEKKVIPPGIDTIKSVDEIMEALTELYINHHDSEELIIPPSFLEGPIFEPTKEELISLGITYIQANTQLKSTPSMVCHITYGPDLHEAHETTHSNVNSMDTNDMNWDINPELTVNQQQAIKEVLRKHRSVFATSLKEVKALKAEPYEIKIKDDNKPIKVTPRMLPVAANEWLKGYIKQLLELELIETCSGPWAAAVVLVPNDKNQRKPRRRYQKLKKVPRILTVPDESNPKPVWSVSMAINLVDEAILEETNLSTLEELRYANGNTAGLTSNVPELTAGNKDPYRLCLNYKPVNRVVLDTGYPIPNINFLFTLLANVKYYSVFDCLKGFWQMELAKSSRDLTGFSTTFGQYRWKRLPMGLKVSPHAWQSFFSQTFEDHVEHLDRILSKAKAANLSLSITKCKFGYYEVKLLGHVVGENGFSMDKAKVERIINWPRPSNVTEINQFIGMIQYYRRYLRGLSEVIAPMNALKKKNVPFIWGTAQETAFQECKQLLTGDHVLAHPDFKRPFILFTDASNYGIAGVLSQADETNEDFIRPVYYGSKALTDAEKRTSIYEKEFLAIVYFIHFFKTYLIGHPFTVYTDQKSLQYLIKFNEEASAKVVRWQASLLAYDFDIIYRPGKLNTNADALSRLKPEYSKGPELDEIIEDYYLPLNAIKRGREDDLSIQQQVSKKHLIDENVYSNSDGMSDELYYNLINYLVRWTFPTEATETMRKSIKNQALSYEVVNGDLYKKPTEKYPRRKVVRSKEVLKVLYDHHDHLMAGHQGVRRTFDVIKNKFYWSGYFDTVRRYVSSCQTCQNFGPRNPPTPLSLNPKLKQEGPFSHVMMDYIYLPLTKSGNCSALVIIDQFTGWIDCKPTPTQSANFTCISLYEWISQYGLMVQIHCDNGPHFNTEEVKTLMMTSYGVQLRFGVPYHPQGQGKVERANGVLKELMKKYAFKYGESWDIWLPSCLYVMRTSSRGDHGYSAFFLVYGRNPRSFEDDDAVYEQLTIEDYSNYDNDVQILERIDQVVQMNLNIIPVAKTNISKYKEKMVITYNKKAKFKIFKIDDMVMILDRNSSELSTSLLPKWLGPFRVAEVVGKDIYKFKDGEMNIPFPFHANQLKLYKARPRLSAVLKFYSKK